MSRKMKIRLFPVLITLLLVSSLLLPNTFAEDYTKHDLPEGAKARFGKGMITDMKLSPNNSRLAVSSTAGVWLYDVSSKTQKAPIKRFDRRIAFQMEFSHNSKILAIGGNDNTIRLWNADTAEDLLTFTTPDGPFRSLKFLPDDNTLIIQNVKGILTFWETSTGKKLETFNPKAANIFVKGGSWIRAKDAFVNDKKQVIFAVGNKDATVSIQDGRNRNQIMKLKMNLSDKHTFPIQYKGNGSKANSPKFDKYSMQWLTSLKFSKDGNTLVSSSNLVTPSWWNDLEGAPGPTSVWDVTTGDQLAMLPWFVKVRFSGDGKTLAIIGYDECVIWDIATRRNIAEYPNGKQAHFSSDGNTVAIIYKDGFVMWDIPSRKEVISHHQIIEWNDLPPEQSVLSNDGSILVTADQKGTVALWETQNVKQLRALITDYTKPFTSLAFSYDGKTFASMDKIGNIRIWDLDSSKKLRTIDSNLHNKNTGWSGNRKIAFTKEKGTILSKNRGAIAEWYVNEEVPRNYFTIPDISSNNYFSIFDDKTGLTISDTCVISGNGEKLAIETKNGIEIWDIPNRTPLKKIEKSLGIVNTIFFAFDGEILAMEKGSTIRLWDLHTDEAFATLKIPKSWKDRWLEILPQRKKKCIHWLFLMMARP